MLTRIEIDGFKSFTNFSMEFSPLTVIAGLNASGKSNLFDALHLLSLLAEKPLEEAFNDEELRGRNQELFTQYADGRVAQEMRFGVEMTTSVFDFPAGEGVNSESPNWKAQFPSIKVRYELIIEKSRQDEAGLGLYISNECLIVKSIEALVNDKPVLETKTFESSEGPVYARLTNEGSSQTYLDQTGKLTAINFFSYGDHFNLRVVQKEIISWKFLNINPKTLPGATLAQAFGLPGPLNAQANNLAGVLYRLSKTDPYLVTRIAQRLASLVPGIKEFKVHNNEYSGVYEVWVLTTAGQRFPLRLLSEGTLRLLALCVLAFDDKQHGVLGLEEPENGVHPGLLKRVAELLRDLSTNEPVAEGEAPWPLRQVIVNTHSPGLIKACLEAAAADAGTADGKPALTVWFSQLVGRPVEEDGKRVLRRVTDMLPVVLPKIQPSEAATAGLSEAERRVSLAQLLRYLETTPADPLLSGLGYPDPTPPLA